ncbi:ribonuclease III [Bdellovibrio sp. HCB337]|uniref:ribonuclease III n=1 Tax=Bdellovibrio sp. HCB337 TaxID=3394358 RepID=UPI0039A41AC0
MTELETKLQIKFKNESLIARAMTHKSFAHELRGKLEHNEKLEFLGDAVLDLVLGEYLMELFPADGEGSLSKKRASLVNEEVLSKLASELELSKFLQLGKGEATTGGAQKPRLLGSAYEALLGAIFLDGGFDVVREFVRREFTKLIEGLDPAQDFERDYKTRLQEVMQRDTKETPVYEIISEEGPPHARVFTVCVRVKEVNLATGTGKSKKAAEQAAAQKALELLPKEKSS